jgi:hypothetical protein
LELFEDKIVCQQLLTLRVVHFQQPRNNKRIISKILLTIKNKLQISFDVYSNDITSVCIDYFPKQYIFSLDIPVFINGELKCLFEVLMHEAMG